MRNIMIGGDFNVRIVRNVSELGGGSREEREVERQQG